MPPTNSKMNTFLKNLRRFHFVGIGGIGMCGLAEILALQGFIITGSDLIKSKTVNRLGALGVKVSIGHKASHIEDAQAIVVSSAIPPENPEVRKALSKGLPIIQRAELLAEVTAEQKAIAISGTHGKTTTASLTWHILKFSGLDPSAVIGGRILFPGSKRTGAHLGEDKIIVIEADESDASFLHFSPEVTVITNIEPEHMNFYKKENELRNTFRRFANQPPKNGLCILCTDDVSTRNLTREINKRIITYGTTGSANFKAENISFAQNITNFEIQINGKYIDEIEVPLLGKHNVLNTLAALIVASEFNIPLETSKKALKQFLGVERRFERRGMFKGITIVDDYAHHPTEISATLKAAKEMHKGRVVIIFQPHRFTRTRDHLDEFAHSLGEADVILISDIYAAGETPIPGIDSERICEIIRGNGHKKVLDIGKLDKAIPATMKVLEEGDLVITAGAGSITSFGPRLLDALKKMI
ncbi:UDP-N-acetylmuramate--L-alanine ligase [Myxococcota bacterium]|nr:UDP-N-acetylmuramate--L-alanine ligase [Myxococcota bacterium]